MFFGFASKGRGLAGTVPKGDFTSAAEAALRKAVYRCGEPLRHPKKLQCQVMAHPLSGDGMALEFPQTETP